MDNRWNSYGEYCKSSCWLGGYLLWFRSMRLINWIVISSFCPPSEDPPPEIDKQSLPNDKHLKRKFSYWRYWPVYVAKLVHLTLFLPWPTVKIKTMAKMFRIQTVVSKSLPCGLPSQPQTSHLCLPMRHRSTIDVIYLGQSEVLLPQRWQVKSPGPPWITLIKQSGNRLPNSL